MWEQTLVVYKVYLIFERKAFEIKERIEKYQNGTLDKLIWIAMFIAASLIPVPQLAFRTNIYTENVEGICFWIDLGFMAI